MYFAILRYDMESVDWDVKVKVRFQRAPVTPASYKISLVSYSMSHTILRIT